MDQQRNYIYSFFKALSLLKGYSCTSENSYNIKNLFQLLSIMLCQDGSVLTRCSQFPGSII